MSISSDVIAALNRYYQDGAKIALGNIIQDIVNGISGGGGTTKLATFSLSPTNISNGYVDLADVAKQDSVVVNGVGYGPFIEGAPYDYSVSLTGGVGGKTRITFLNALATGPSALVSGDVVQARYQV